MRLNQTTDYAIRCLLYLATDGQKHDANEIAEAVRISPYLLRNIMRKLSYAGLLHTVRGANGGYWLAKPPDQISVYDIIEAAGETVCINGCTESAGGCSMRCEEVCPIRAYCLLLETQLHSSLRTMTLEKLRDGASELFRASV